MKKKNIIICLLLVLFILPISVFAKTKTTTTTTTTVDTSKLVKVYIFEKDGCTYCEAEKTYLEGLDSYNQKFTVVVKRLYDANWNPDVDYELGSNVADAFASAGFTTDVNSTPLVIISDLYAANAYSDSLEEIINQAYEEGDKDAVSCIENGGANSECISGAKNKAESDSDVAGLLIFLIAIGIVVAIIVTSRVNKNNAEYYQE